MIFFTGGVHYLRALQQREQQLIAPVWAPAILRGCMMHMAQGRQQGLPIKDRLVRTAPAVIATACNRITSLILANLCVLSLVALYPLVADADVRYVYDTAGRLVQVVAADGSYAIYQYDSAGNIAGIARANAGDVGVATFSPASGAPGTAVTISGSGFSITASNNVVKFNGVVAAVSAATASQLTVTVPVGATSGSISVTTGANTGTSSETFTVLAPLAITSFAPATAPAGAAVTVNGTGFDAFLNSNVVTFNGTIASISSVSATQLQVNVPAAATSGKISVSTLEGSATSTNNFFVLPPGYSSADTVTGELSAGVAQSVTIPTSKRLGLYAFEGTEGSYYSLILGNFSSTPGGGSVTATIVKPDGTTLINCGTYTASSGNCDTGRLPITGTYLIKLTLSSTSSYTFNIVLSADLHGGSLTLNAAPVSYDVAILGQNKRYAFSGTAGQLVSLVFTGNTISAGTVYVFKPDGSLLTNTSNYGGNPGWTMDLASLPVSGTYTIVVYVDRTSSGHINVAAVTDVTGTAPTDGTATAVSLLSGQNATYTFSSVGSRGYSFMLSNLTSAPSGGSVNVTIRKPDGTTLQSCGTFTATSGLCDFWIPTTGTYQIRIDPAGTAAVSFNIILSEDLDGGALTMNAAPVGYDVAVYGQNKRYTFSGTAGQPVSLVFTSNTISTGTVYVYKPGGLLTNTSNFGGNPGWVTDIASLPVSGTYTVVVYVDRTSSGHINVAAVTDVTGTAPTDGTATAVSLLSGQNLTYTFQASAGSVYSVALANLSSVPAGGSVNVVIRKPGGSTLSNCGNITANTGNCDFYVPTSGTYAVRLDPAGTAALSFEFVLSADLLDSLTVNDPPVAFNASVPGRNIRYSFAGTASQAVTLRYTNNTIARGTVVILKPDGSTLTSYLFYSGTSSGVRTATLPSAGTYFAVVYVDGSSTGSMNVQVTSP